MNRIAVIGNSTITVVPDTVKVTMESVSKSKQYNQLMDIAAQNESCLVKAVQSVGFEKDSLKTQHLDVSVEYQNYKDQDGSYKSRFEFFVCRQKMTIQFALADNKLSQLLSAVSAADAQPTFDICFLVQDKQSAITKVLQAACKDAQARAEILAQSMGHNVGRLVRIRNLGQSDNFVSETHCNIASRNAVMSLGAVPNVTPTDITLSASVHCAWELI